MKRNRKLLSVLLSAAIVLSVAAVIPHTAVEVEAAAALEEGFRRLEAESYAEASAYMGTETSDWYSNGTAVARGVYQNKLLLTEEELKNGVDKNNPYITYRVSAPVAGDYTLKIGYAFGTNGTLPSGTTAYLHIYVNGVMYKYSGIGSALKISLNAGMNTIVCGIFSKELYTAVGETNCWVNYDYIDIEDCVYASPADDKSGAYLRMEAETDSELFMYLAKTTTSFSNGGSVGNGYYIYEQLRTASEMAQRLNRNMPRVIFFVSAPADGWYNIRPAFSFWTAASSYPASYYVYIYVNGVSHKVTKSGGTAPVVSVKLSKGVNEIACSVFDKELYQSVGSVNTAIDYDALDVSSALTPLAPIADTNVTGLIKDSMAVINGDRVIYSDLGLNAATVKGNFMSGGGITLADSEGKELSATQRAAAGSVISYESGPEYTVCYRGDENLDDCIDVRDLKKAKQHVFDSANTVDGVLGDINNDGKVDSADVTAYRDYILGKTSDTTYTRKTYGASALLSLCNPVGRLAEHKGSMFMEASAASFTLYGEMQGDVKLTLHLEEYGTDESALFVEVDGDFDNVIYVKLESKSGLRQDVTIVSGLPAGVHKIQISKGSDLKNDNFMFDTVTVNGTLRQAPAAERKIEYLGDSITSGHGVYPYSAGYGHIHSYQTYANRTADKFGADHYSISNCSWGFAHSKRTKDSCIPCIYPLQSMQHDYGNYDFNEWQPDVVVINLGTNDRWVGATAESYKADIDYTLSMVRAARPNAKIIWVYGMMTTTNEDWLIAGINAYNTAKGDNVVYHRLPMNTDGQAGHPDLAGTLAATESLAGKIAELTGWNMVK